MSYLPRLLVFGLTLSLAVGQTPLPPYRLPGIFSDHMVLQAGTSDPVWGWAPTGTAVHVTFVDSSGKTLADVQAVSDAQGKWSGKLPVLASGAAGELHIEAGPKPAVVIHDVVVGEDWLCGGQSNMTYQIKSFNTTPESVAVAQKEATDANSAIRYFAAGGGAPDSPNEDVPGKWFIGTPETVPQCSAVGWNFAVALREKLHVPVGLIISCIGGTQAELWIPKEALDATPTGLQVEKRYQDANDHLPDRQKKYDADNAAWLAANPTPELKAQNKKTQPHQPTANQVSKFYNGKIHGLEPFGMKGVIWFQADGNMGFPAEYGVLIKTLITSWRQRWQTELPFYYVEMNNMRDVPQTKPVQFNNLCLIREQQEAALELPGTDVACSIDLGLLVPEPHFPNKNAGRAALGVTRLQQPVRFPLRGAQPTTLWLYRRRETDSGSFQICSRIANSRR